MGLCIGHAARCLLSAIVLTGLAAISVARADTLFVSPDGTDGSATASRDAPLRNPHTAAQRALAGDIVFLLPGTFVLPEQIQLKAGVDLIGSGATGDDRTTVTAEWTETAYQSSLGWNNGKYLVRVQDAGNQRIAHFALDGNEWTIIGGLITQGSDNLEVHDLHFTDFYFTCAWFEDGDSLHVHHLDMRNSAFESTGYSAGHINVGTIADSRFDSIHIYSYRKPSGYGVKALGKISGTAYWKRIVFSNFDIDIKARAAWNDYQAPNICLEAHNVTAEECELRDSHLSGNISLACQDRYSGPAHSIEVHRNVIECDSSYAIELSAAKLHIHHNYLVSGGGIANWAGADKPTVLDGISIHHNVVEGSRYGTFMYLKYGMTKFTCYNNVFITSENRQHVFKVYYDKPRSGWEVRNNVFLCPEGHTISLVQLNEGATAPEMAFTHNFSRGMTVNVTPNEESNNRIGEPDLRLSGDKPTPWYLPTSDGNLVDSGYDMGWSYAGDAPDIGAYEADEVAYVFAPLTLQIGVTQKAVADRGMCWHSLLGRVCGPEPAGKTVSAPPASGVYLEAHLSQLARPKVLSVR